MIKAGVSRSLGLSSLFERERERKTIIFVFLRYTQQSRSQYYQQQRIQQQKQKQPNQHFSSVHNQKTSPFGRNSIRAINSSGYQNSPDPHYRHPQQRKQQAHHYRHSSSRNSRHYNQFSERKQQSSLNSPHGVIQHNDYFTYKPKPTKDEIECKVLDHIRGFFS